MSLFSLTMAAEPANHGVQAVSELNGGVIHVATVWSIGDIVASPTPSRPEGDAATCWFSGVAAALGGRLPLSQHLTWKVRIGAGNQVNACLARPSRLI